MAVNIVQAQGVVYCFVVCFVVHIMCINSVWSFSLNWDIETALFTVNKGSICGVLAWSSIMRSYFFRAPLSSEWGSSAQADPTHSLDHWGILLQVSWNVLCHSLERIPFRHELRQTVCKSVKFVQLYFKISDIRLQERRGGKLAGAYLSN